MFTLTAEPAQFSLFARSAQRIEAPAPSEPARTTKPHGLDKLPADAVVKVVTVPPRPASERGSPFPFPAFPAGVQTVVNLARYSADAEAYLRTHGFMTWGTGGREWLGKVVRGHAERPKRIKREPIVREIVKRLRLARIPYAEIDRAGTLCDCIGVTPPFHLCIYQRDGENWILLAREPNDETRRIMREWSEVFGDCFVARFAVERTIGGRAELVFLDADGHRCKLDDFR